MQPGQQGLSAQRAGAELAFEMVSQAVVAMVNVLHVIPPFSKNTPILRMAHSGADVPILKICPFFDAWSLNQAIFTMNGIPGVGVVDAEQAQKVTQDNAF